MRVDNEELRSRIRRCRIDTSGWKRGVALFKRVLRAAHQGEYHVALIVGESGTGKSILLDHFVEKNPPIRDSDGISRKVLSVNTPHHATPISLLEAILEELGDPSPESGNRRAKMKRVSTLLREQHVDVLMLDDLQHIVDKGQDIVLYDSAECLKEVIIRNRVGVIGVGLHDAQQVINSNEQLKRRAIRGLEIERYDWLDDDSQDEFVGVLSEFQSKVAEIEMPDLAGAEMALRMYLASGGLIDFVAAILAQTIWDAVDSGRRKVRMSDLRNARDVALWDDGMLGENPFEKKYDLDKDLGDRIALAKKINQRVVRPISKRSAARRNHLQEIGL